ncbi:hypothetical protein TL16_g12915 [Triparma laevis f. inornata]|uniref:Uncharacterized protein n=1 Tax=Triparma laevis f. inornata TaxID=1714386 RepID=A0A9W7BNF0_9STRA|nr:hypothetical protein TL16_g12915 [Triparma laevis f. inornata]
MRGDAKGLYGRVVKGREERVKMHRVHGTAGGRAVAKKCYEETPIVIWCCGYVTNTVPITTDLNPIELSSLRAKFNSQGQKVDSTGETVDPNIAPTPPPAKSTGSNSSPNTNGSNTGRISPAIPVPELATRHKKEVNLLYDGSQVDVDYEARVLQESSANPEGVPLPGVYGVGLGWGLRAVFKDGTKDGSSGRMDGYGIYLKRAATSILGNVIICMGGDSGRVFGEGNDNWDERQKALLKKFGDARERRLSDSPTRSASKAQQLLNSPKANTKGEEKKECSPVRRNISTAPSSPMPNRGKSQAPPDEASTPVANNRKKSIASSSKKKDKEKEKKKEAEEKKDAEVTTAKKKEEKKKKEEENKEKEKEREETNNSPSSSPNKPPSSLTELQKQATVKRLSTPSTSSRPSTSHAALDSVPTPVVTKKMTEEQTQATVRRLSTAKKVEVVEGKEKKSKKSFKSDAELLKSVNRLATVVKKEREQINAEKEKEDQPTQPTLYKTDTGSNPSHETATKTNKKTKKKKRVRPDLPLHTPPRSPPEEGEVVAAPILASTRSDTSESSFQSCNSSLPPTRPTSSEMPESKSGNVNVKEKGRTTPLPNNGWFNASDGGGEKDAKVYQNLTVEVDNNGKKEKSNGGKKEKEKEKEKEKNNLPPLFSPIKQSKKGGKQEPLPSYNSSNYAEAPPPYTPENYQPKSVPASPSNGIWVPGGGAATAPSREQKEAFEKYDAMYQKRSNLYTKLKTNAVKAACSGGGGSGLSGSSSGRRHTSVGGSIGFGGGVTAANGGYGTRNSNNSKVALMTRKIEMEFSMPTFSGPSRNSFSCNRNSGERIHSSKLQLTVPGSKFSSSIGGMGARGRRHTALGFGAGSSAKGDSGVGAMGNKSFAAHVNNVKASRLNKR